MLQSIRDHTQGWIAGIIISLLILSFALWGIHSYLVGGSTSTVVAKVNGTEITKGQLAVTYERLRRQLQTQFSGGPMPEGAEATLKDRALQTLISIQVLKQASIDQDYRVSDRQVDGLLESMPDFQVNGQFSLNRFQQVLSTTMYNVGDFLDLIKTSLLIDQPRLGLIFSSSSLPDEVNVAIALVNQEREIQYAILPSLDFLKQPIAIANDRVEAYYTAHQNEFRTPEQVSIEYVELSVKDLMSTLHPTEQELKTFYNENTNSFAVPMQWKVEGILIPVAENANAKEVNDAQAKTNEVLQKINKGENFSDFSRLYPTGKSLEKLQGWVALNQVPEELQKSLISLTKVNQVSLPVRINSGFLVLKATDVKEAKIKPFDNVQEQVKEAYTRQAAEEKYADLKDKLTNTTYEHPDSLKPAAEALGLQIKTTGPFTKEKGGNDISSHIKIRDAAFGGDVLNSQNNSDVILLGPDSAVVLRIKSHSPATLLPLKIVDKQITEKLRIEEANAQTQKLANEIKAKLAAGAALDQIAGQYHLTWNNVGYIGRHATKVDSAILNEAFSMPKPSANKPAYSTVQVPNGYAVIALSGVKDGTLNNKQEEFDLFAEQVQNTQGLLEYELYKNSLMKQAKIVVEDQDKTTLQ